MARTPTTPHEPRPDIAGHRLPFAAVPGPLQPRESENDRAYCAFLLSCMQAERSIRKIAKAMGISDGTVRFWRKRHTWDRRRVTAPEAEWEALRAYRLLMDLQDSSTQVAALRVALDVVLDSTGFASLRHAVAAQRQGLAAGPARHDVDPMGKPGTEGSALGLQAPYSPPGSQAAPVQTGGPSDQPGMTEAPARTTAAPAQPGSAAAPPAVRSPLSDNELREMDVEAHYRRVRDHVLTNHLRPEDVRRQVQLIDGTLGLIAKKVASGELEVKVSDIPALLKARAMLTGLPTERVAVQQQHQHEHHVVVESTRMRDARPLGEHAVLAAMQTELTELQVIIDAVPRTVLDVPAGGAE